MAAISAQMHIGYYDYINISFVHKLKFGGTNAITASKKQFRYKNTALPVFFLIKFYLERAKEIKYNNKQAYGEK
ncbi:hypothetical protein GCM10011413_27550 [Pedobacter psychrotolerans]|uniref:Uncharacterized protein n=1 Tax=Pedobacter psychrotolerans TaxID=1843235 RepID=A0ABQ1STH8_9SPHI|nr:hypothetical protein GCM10011413_27550 [Pedobacter psychrotolerans]